MKYDNRFTSIMTTDTTNSSESLDESALKREKMKKILSQSQGSSEPLKQDNVEHAKDMPESGIVHDLKLQLSAVQKELQESKEQYLRDLAELQNRLRRKDQEKETSLKFAQQKFFQDFLLVLDSIDGALMQDPEGSSVQQYREGLTMMSSQIESLLQSFHLEPVVPEVGTLFSPESSEAMSMQPTTDHEHNSVLVVVQKGYRYQGRLIRPARVIVAQNLEEPVEKS